MTKPEDRTTYIENEKYWFEFLIYVDGIATCTFENLIECESLTRDVIIKTKNEALMLHVKELKSDNVIANVTCIQKVEE